MEAIFLSHNGLGDNITSIGAINFLLNYYSKIYFLCKDKHQNNCRLLYNNLNVEIVPFDSNREDQHCSQIISPYYTNLNADILICGSHHKKNLKSKITNNNFLNYIPNDEHYKIEYDFIRQFYWDINLDLKIYYEYFKINSTKDSIDLYDKVKEYNIYFIHTQASDMKIDISNYTNEYLYDDKWIIICANENMYNNQSYKYNLANEFINIPIAHYIDIILNAKKIYVVNSCFSCIIYPLKETKKLLSETTNIYNR